jgi:hypothetical protein
MKAVVVKLPLEAHEIQVLEQFGTVPMSRYCQLPYRRSVIPGPEQVRSPGPNATRTDGTVPYQSYGTTRRATRIFSSNRAGSMVPAPMD